MLRLDHASASFLILTVSILAGCGDDDDDTSGAGAAGGATTSASSSGGSGGAGNAGGGGSGGAGGTAGTGGAGGGGADVTIACGQSGVTVSGTVVYSGAVDAASKGYINFSDPIDGFPTCFIEFMPDALPLTFEFTAVPDEPWQLQAYVDLDGGFPPVPTTGDPLDRLEAAEIDLSADVTDIVFELEPLP